MKLRTKIQLFTSLFMLLLVLLINASIYLLFYRNSVDSELNELTEQTTTIIQTMNKNQEIPAKELLEAFLPPDGMIRVFPENGDPLVSSKPGIDYLNFPGKYSNKEIRQVITYQGDRFATVSRPLIWSTGEIVTLQISKQLVGLEENMRNLFYVLIVASIIIIIPIIIAGNILARFLLRPIKTLISTMRENMKFTKWQKIELNNRSKDELYEMEKTFNEMIDSLKENYEMQEIFVSDASHELKTPISIIKSYAQLLERRGKENPELIEESLEAITSEANRMQKLVEQMLALAKNKEIHSAERIVLNELLGETVEVFKGAYGREIEFLDEEKQLQVHGNQDQLKQVFYILIDNALKYSDDKVKVSIKRVDEQVAISVADHGAGIPDEEQDRVFERFYRMDKARSRNTGGTGLGLAIAKTIVNIHGGTITVESKLGEGSTFTVRLPIYD
ncbi:HAMP domain-containing sensor histidine kinase [Ornithinibacillus scapharcae]|uniref:HAMP domain-containing sensor histidine kinase n=1 Tax=Ornithinibacillus scapharcae TaxID=1147159 RepID=UPI000225BE54|nr:HAMP domain-containing histidine kinase [Ornithinibacillus scapharcae]